MAILNTLEVLPSECPCNGGSPPIIKAVKLENINLVCFPHWWGQCSENSQG